MRLARPTCVLGLLAALAACDGEPVGFEPPPGSACRAVPITAEQQIEPGMWQVRVEPGSGALGGLCPVSDASIRMGGDALFAFTAPRAGRYQFRKIGSATMVSLHADCDRGLEPLACAPSPHYHDEGLGRWPLGVTRALEAGESVLIQVDGYGDPRQLGLTVFGPAAEGEACGEVLCDFDDWCLVPACVEGAVCHEALCRMPAPPGDLGAGCDGFARCAEGLYCAEGACAVPPEPVLLSAWAHRSASGAMVYAEMRIDDPGRVLVDARLRLEDSGFDIAGLGSGDPRRAYLSARDPDGAEAVELVDGDGRVWFREPIVPQPVLAAGEPCAPYSQAARCAEGTVCEPGEAPRCVPVEVFVWSDQAEPSRIVIDIRGAALPLDARVAAGWGIRGHTARPDRWLGRSSVAIEGPVDVLVFDHPVASAVPVMEPPPRAEGEGCDPDRVADRCADRGTACRAGVCGPVSPPIIEAAVVVDVWEGSGVWIRGRDPDGDVSGFRIGNRVRDLSFGPPDPARFDAWPTGAGLVDGDVFEAWLSTESRVFGDIVVAVDAEGLESPPFAAEAARPEERPAVEAGEDCDPLGLLWPCAEGLTCARPDDGDGQARCGVTEPACPEGLATPIALGELLVFDGPGATSQTRVMCRDPFGELPERYLTFVAPEDGWYRASAVGDNMFGFAVRQSCLDRYSEVACGEDFYRTNPNGVGGHGIGVTVVFEATAGEVLTLVIDGMDQVRVSVER